MTHMELSISVKKDINKIYNCLTHMEYFSTFMKNVRLVNVYKIDDSKYITSWKIEIDDAEIIWEEEDVFDEMNYRIIFNLIRGDYSKYSGVWQLERDERGCKIFLRVDLDWGVPVFTKFVGHILEKKTKHALSGMLLAIKKKMEGSS